MNNPVNALTPDALNGMVQQVIRNPLVSGLVGQIQGAIRAQKIAAHPNPLTRKGCKYFSQNDEDGILLEIFRRIDNGGDVKKTFIEFGVGNGLENNSLILLMQGWRGFWAGGEDLAFTIKNHDKFAFHKGWINRETALAHYMRGCAHAGTDKIDLFSIDLDGTDIYVAETILAAGHRPRVIVCEYNGKFPPPIEFTVAYDPQFMWNGSDYFGASLQSYVNCLSRYDYRLVACNITGANAFFVQQSHADRFADIPTSIDQIFVAADYGLVTGRGHPMNLATLGQFI